MTDRVALPPDLLDRLRELRRALHMHPELSGEERETSLRVADALEGLGLTVRRGVGGHGLVADVPGRGDGPMVALRADMDALPVTEKTGLPFASVRPGVMHACGHDGHTAMLVGAAALLVAEPPPGPVRLLFQPAEEVGTGASAMIRDGALDGVAMIFGGHVDRRWAPGAVVVGEGPVNASTDSFDLVIRGRGGHGARPHEAIDALLAGCAVVQALQSVVSRELDPSAPAVLSVGRFQAGCAPNVVAERATLSGTLRALAPAVRAQLKEALVRVATGVASAHRAEVDMTWHHATPAVINTPGAAALAREAAVEVCGQATPLPAPVLGGDDFAWYLEQVPGCYVRYGARREGADFPVHSGAFDLDERCLGVGAAWLAAVARRAGAELAG